MSSHALHALLALAALAHGACAYSPPVAQSGTRHHYAVHAHDARATPLMVAKSTKARASAKEAKVLVKDWHGQTHVVLIAISENRKRNSAEQM